MKRPAGYRLVLMADGSTRVKSVRMTPRGIIFWCFTCVTILASLIFGSSYFIANHLTRQAMSSVLQENSTLKSQILSVNERVNILGNDLTNLAQSDDQLRLVADLPLIDKDIRRVGIGGIATDVNDYGIQDETVRSLFTELDRIEREARLQHNSFAEIERRINERSALFLHTPSVRPVMGGYVSSRFGFRRDPFNGRKAHHNGIDISIERGSVVRATANGKIVFAQATPGLGRLIVIDHGYGFRTAYGHLNTINVSKGQTVERDQKIGTSGNTGRSTAPHLHYEVHVNNKAVDPLDFFFDNMHEVASLVR